MTKKFQVCVVVAIATMCLSSFSFAKPLREPIQPVPKNRFVDCGEYIEDTKTGLLWQKDGVQSGKMTFYQAAEYAKGLKLSGVTGWRVPNKEELAAIFPATDLPFRNTPYNQDKCCQGPIPFDSYWTSNFQGGDSAYVYQWYSTGGANNCATGNLVYVRCVHDPVKR